MHIKRLLHTYRLLFPALLLLCSCSLQKRHYMPGYYLAGKSHVSKENGAKPGSTASIQTINQESPKPVITASAKRAPVLLEKPITIPTQPIKLSALDGCDTLLLKNGKKIAGKIVKRTSSAVTIGSCSGQGSTTTEIPLSAVTEIQHADGSREPVVYVPGDANKIENLSAKDRQDTEKSNDAHLKGRRSGVAALVFLLLTVLGVLIAIMTWIIYFVIPFLILTAVFCIRSLHHYNLSSNKRGIWTTYTVLTVFALAALFLIIVSI